MYGLVFSDPFSAWVQRLHDVHKRFWWGDATIHFKPLPT